MDGRRDISMTRLCDFFREHRIIKDRKQLDEMIKQCFYVGFNQKDITFSQDSVTLHQFKLLFLKPLLLIGMENVLALVEHSESSTCLQMLKLHRSYMFQLVNTNPAEAKQTVPVDLDKSEIVKYMA